MPFSVLYVGLVVQSQNTVQVDARGSRVSHDMLAVREQAIAQADVLLLSTGAGASSHHHASTAAWWYKVMRQFLIKQQFPLFSGS